MRVTGEIISMTPFAMYPFDMHARIISTQPPPNKFEGATLLIFPTLKCNYRIGNTVSYLLALLQKSLVKTASTEAGIYRFVGASINISGRHSKRYRPEFIPAKAGVVCRHSGARVASALCPILHHGRQIIPRYAVAHKALNPRTLG